MSTITPQMSLTVPSPGTTSGPEYALDINNSFRVLDSHDHSPGSGNLITPLAINVNSALAMNNQFLTTIAGLTLQAQTTTPASSTIYRSGQDLFFVDGLGTNIRLTQSGGVAGTPGSISNLVAPASAAYVAGSQTFIFQSGTNLAANLDSGSVILRNLTLNSPALTLAPPAIPTNYQITLPLLPSATLPIVMNTSGTMAAQQVSNTMIADGSISTAKLQDGSVTVSKLGVTNSSTRTVLSGAAVWIAPAGVTQIVIEACGGGGGGGGGANTNDTVNGGGAGGAGAPLVLLPFTVVPGTSYSYSVGGGGSGGAAAAGTPGNSNPAAGQNGAAGGNTTFASLTFFGAVGGQGGLSSGATPNASGLAGAGFSAFGGGASGRNGVAGQPSNTAAAGTPGTDTTSAMVSCGGGSGGAGVGAGGNGASSSGTFPTYTIVQATAGATSAGGGGGGGGFAAYVLTPGANGGAGYLAITYSSLVNL